ncbi:hypothetical protein KAM333_31810 [Aeromonas caviae]|nr:hypothetical protein KAM329_023300 [Aeromonas caviae]BDA18358.1 hypothetical protein KAM345_022720 [Aeromonas caviae]BDN88411.1 hypothetical protein KAM471c_22260 [Aeromonas caviae]GJA07753.1 hypothetical protein KAM333_31810 [Aeromonas caviae]GJA12267.1 hypothetical protein KAM334_35780 [Aeromonas caviae]
MNTVFNGVDNHAVHGGTNEREGSWRKGWQRDPPGGGTACGPLVQAKGLQTSAQRQGNRW